MGLRPGSLRRRTPLRRRNELPRATRAHVRTGDKGELRAARRIERRRAQGEGALTAWEARFVGERDDGVAPRIRCYARAWGRDELADPQDSTGPLSLRQRRKVTEFEPAAQVRRDGPRAVRRNEHGAQAEAETLWPIEAIRPAVERGVDARSTGVRIVSEIGLADDEASTVDPVLAGPLDQRLLVRAPGHAHGDDDAGQAPWQRRLCIGAKSTPTRLLGPACVTTVRAMGNAVRGRGRDRIVPVYARCAARQPNLAPEVATTLVCLWGEDVLRDDPWYYTVAMLAAPGNDGLVPVSAGREFAREAVSIGRQIGEARCGTIRVGATRWIRCEGRWRAPRKVRYDKGPEHLRSGPDTCWDRSRDPCGTLGSGKRRSSSVG